MMLSEEEAKTKWCPHVQVSVSIGIDGTEQDDNRQTLEGQFERSPVCIASKCMAWRWGPRFWIDPDEKSEPKTRYSTDHKPGMELEPAKGFCGLAGPSS